MTRVAISELKSHLSEHLRRAEAGETFEIMDRARPIAKVVPFEHDAGGLEVVPPACSFVSVRRVRVRPASLSTSSLEVLRRERGSR
jgi:prevent-host-death family protein